MEHRAESDGANLEAIRGESVRASAGDSGRCHFLVMSHSTPHYVIQKMEFEPACNRIQSIEVSINYDYQYYYYYDYSNLISI